MSAAPSVRAPGPAGPPALLESYRDDGAPAHALGAALGARVPLPPALLEGLGAGPLVVLMVWRGEAATNAQLALALGVFILLGGLASGRPHRDRLRWAAPPVLRAVEYGATLYLGALAGRSSEAAALALIGALAFRHYDLVYRVRHQGAGVPGWVSALALGWDGRLILGWVLLAAGALPAGYFALAALFAVVFVGEAAASWRRFGRTAGPPVDDNFEEDFAE